MYLSTSLTVFYTMFITCSFLPYTTEVNLPDSYPKCPDIKELAELPAFEKCIVNSALAWKPILLKGIPVLNFPPIKNFTIPKAEVKQTARAFAFDVIFKNISVEGLDLFLFDKYNYDLKTRTHIATMRFPELCAEGEYKMAGHFLGQKINREGSFNGTANNTLIYIKLYTALGQRDGETYMNITNSDIDIKIGKIFGNFGKLFGEAEILNRAITQFLKDSTNDVFEAAKPDIIKALRQLIASTINTIVDNIPYNSIFPPK